MRAGGGLQKPNGEAIGLLFGLSVLSVCACLSGLCLLREHLPERVRGQNKNMAANLGAAQIVNFSVQFARVGICRHFLVCGLVYDANL